MRERNYKIAMGVLLVLCFTGVAAAAETARSFVDGGNKLYNAGKFAEAASEYDKAIEALPDAMEPKFNKAKCKFKLEEIDEAIELFKQAATGSKDSNLVARAKFNLGNSHFKRAAGGHEGDAKKVIEDILTSISFWRQSLDIEPGNLSAAKNIEIALGQLKFIKEIMEKQAQLQKMIQELRQKLERLLEEQTSLSTENKTTKSQADSGAMSPEQAAGSYKQQTPRQVEVKGQTQEANNDAAKARKLEEQIEAVTGGPANAQQTPQGQQPPQQSALEMVKAELAQAISQQSAAEGKLSSAIAGEAIAAQDKAAEHIKNALDALKQSEEEQQQQQDQQEKQEQEKKEQEQQQQDQQQQEQEQSQEKEQEEKKAEAAKATAEEILNKEKKDRKERQIMRLGRKKVEKDW